MSDRLAVEIQHLPGLLKRFRTLDFVARPATDFIRDWSSAMYQEIIDTAPTFRGDLKSSFYINIESSYIPKFGQVYSDDPKARWLEYGTGELSEDPQSSQAAYFPPPSRLRDWSSAHGMDPYVVALGIFRRGGTRPTHFLSNATDAVNSRIGVMVTNLGQMIELEASR